MPINQKNFKLRDHCHIATNESNDRFVGIKIDSMNVAIHFPIGYCLPLDDEELRRDIKNLINVLSLVPNNGDNLLQSNSYSERHPVYFPIHAYLNVINYYFDHNGTYYNEREQEYRTKISGKTDFKRTIKKVKPVMNRKNPIYLNRVVRETTPNFNKIITQINKYCVWESFDKIGWLFTTNQPSKPDINFEKNKFITALNDKINCTNNDADKILFYSMLAMIKFVDNHAIDKQFYFGTDRFEYIWQKLIDVVFGESNKDIYFPYGLWTEKFGSNKGKKSSALVPDSIMVFREKFYVLDAKYYKYGTHSELNVNFLPHSSDINKQITYGKYVSDNSHGKQVFNAFLMPYNMNQNNFGCHKEYANVAEATGNWCSSNLSHEKVQGIVIDIRHLLKNYIGNHDKDKEKLAEVIEQGLII